MIYPHNETLSCIINNTIYKLYFKFKILSVLQHIAKDYKKVESCF